MAFDYKKEYKEFYLPKTKPQMVCIPAMNFIAVRGRGNPNEEEGDYQKALGMLYAVAFTIKMSRRSGHEIEGFFDYVVPPLEGLWQQDAGDADSSSIDYSRKDAFSWISMIRLPDFVTQAEVQWAKAEVVRKKKQEVSRVEWFRYDEGLCVQCMHIGPYDDEPNTVALMEQEMKQNGCALDVCSGRLHHEIYLSDPRRCQPDKLRTVIRHPVKKQQ